MAMEIQSPLTSQRREEPEFMNLREWGVRARMISRDNTLSRRFSSSYITSFREDGCKSFRSNFTISSTASSPGYSLKEEIDPSTYSFTTALKALQLRSINTWEYLSPDQGFALNSKWNEAEKYICNPLSGEVPMECLSSKTLMNGRSFRNITNRMTMSAPLIHHSSRLFHGAPHQHQHKLANVHPLQDDIDQAKENKIEAKTSTMIMKRDVGIQSTPTDTSPSPSAASTPPIHERSMKDNLASQAMDSPNSSSKSKSECQAEVKEEKEEETKKDDEDDETQKLRERIQRNIIPLFACAGKENLGVACLSGICGQEKNRNREIKLVLLIQTQIN